MPLRSLAKRSVIPTPAIDEIMVATETIRPFVLKALANSLKPSGSSDGIRLKIIMSAKTRRIIN